MARKNSPSSAIAKKMRGDVRIDPTRVEKVASITTTDTAPIPIRPSTACAASAAASGDRAIRGSEAATVALPHEKRKQNEQQQCAVLRAGGEIQDERAPAYAVIVQRRGGRDGRRGDVVHQRGVLRQRRVPAERAQQILGKGSGNRAERGGPDQHQLRPPEEKRRQSADPLADIYVH